MKKKKITTEYFKEPQESDVFVPCPIVWSGDCGCVTLCLELQTVWELEKNAPVMLWLASDIPHSHTSLAGGWDNNVMSKWHIHNKTLSKNTHIYCTRKDALNQNTILSYWCAFQWKKISFHFPHSTQLTIWKLS